MIFSPPGGHHQRLDTESATTTYSETACAGTTVTLSCEAAGGTIAVVRAVWGRYSTALCPDPASNTRAAAGQCGDTTSARRIVSAACRGRARCELEASTRTLGDPCPGTTELLEVQYRCTRAPEPEAERKPRFSDDNIALVWSEGAAAAGAGADLGSLVVDRLTVISVPSRVPITPAPAPPPQVTPAPATSAAPVSVSWVVAAALAPVLLLLGLALLRTSSSARAGRGRGRHLVTKASSPAAPGCLLRLVTSKPRPEPRAGCLMEGGAGAGCRLVYCRPADTSLALARQFSSEPCLAVEV